ncbi:hypothetical protein [Phenylobacterium sp.]|uniref:hypothetical protein n=1 Tax=Phenylobacterium sp. TaxID=1871053 RepID=UPI002D080BCA|nr:hypothetical protein [Phenylobacterium sp.]HLZ73523.1 hypothetical protein [Phenylobacterium sp.]
MDDPTADISVLSRLELYFSIRQFTRTTRRFAEIFGYDYEMVMIFFVVVEACFQAILNLGGAATDRDAIEQIYLDSAGMGVSLAGVADASGIPRETVRRKVKALTDLGYVAVSEKTKNLYIPISAFFDLNIFDAFRLYVADIDQFVRTLQFYAKDAR